MKLNFLITTVFIVHLSIGLSAQECDIEWIDFTKTTQTGTTLSKTSGGKSWNADARSLQTIAADDDGHVIYQVGANDLDNNELFVLGLNAVNDNASYTDLDYGIRLLNSPSNPSNFSYSVLNGVTTYIGAFQEGDKFRIRRTGNTIYVDKQPSGLSTWITLDSATAYISGQLPELFADVAFLYQGTSTSNARISYPLPASFAGLNEALNTSFYQCRNGELKFKYTEDYDHNAEALEAKVYDNTNQLVESLSLTKSTGINTYAVDLKASTNYTDGAYYVLQVTDLKKRTYYLRFRYED
jgi:hypothetical protein